jgi:hypothetical protein
MITRMQAHSRRASGGPPPGNGGAGLRLLAGLVGLAVVVNLVVALGYLASPRGTPISGVAPPPTVAADPAAPALDRSALEALLDRRSEAVLARDRGGFLGTVDPAAADFLVRQRRLFDNLSRLPLALWRYRAEGIQAAGPGGWWIRLTLSYRLRGFDTSEVARHQYVHVAHRRGAGWVIAGDGSAQRYLDDPEVWDGGTLTVVRGGRSLVLGADAQERTLRQIAERIDAAVPLVSGMVGDSWARRAVVLVPQTQQQAAALVGQGQDLGQIAALATVVGGPGQAADRIVVAPRTFPRLSSLGRRVVLTHELTHVATGGARDTRTPMWLVEGLADYVGYKGLAIAPTAAARELAREVRDGELPATLPDQDDFASSSPRLSQSYQEAWLACRMIAQRYGEDKLWQLYRTAGGTPDSGATGSDRGAGGDGRQRETRALRSVLGVDAAAFIEMWHDYLREELA